MTLANHDEVDVEFQAVVRVASNARVCDLFQAVRKLGQIRQMLSDVFQDADVKKACLLVLRRVAGVLCVVFVDGFVQLVSVMPIQTSTPEINNSFDCL